MLEDLEGQNVVVVGGSSGIGFAVAERARDGGASVFAISRTGRAPDRVIGISADVGDSDSLSHAFASIGLIDHLVYTVASRSGAMPVATLEKDDLRTAFETKLYGAVHAVRLALPFLTPTATITLTSGQVSRKYGVGSMVKGSVNAAVDAAGRHLAKELAPRRVNVVSPGVVNTDIWGEEGSESRRAIIARVSDSLPVKRVGTPQELASAYVFSMTAGFVTGAVIDVDGGGLL